MRIISQTGMDFPYEQIVVMVDENKVVCKPINDMNGKSYVLGVYKDCEAATETFNEIYEKYESFRVDNAGNGNIIDGFYINQVFLMPG